MQRPPARSELAKITQRAELARRALVAAKTESARSDALLAEVRAALALEQLADSAQKLDPSLRAALVQTGDLSAEQAVEAIAALSANELPAALDPIASVLSASEWRALLQRVPSASSYTWRWLRRACARGALSECLAVFERDAECNGPFIADVYEAHGRAGAARFASHARAWLEGLRAEGAGGDNEDFDQGDQAAALLALPVEEARPRAIELCASIQATPDAALYFDEGYGQRDPRSTIVTVLVLVGEFERARTVFERLLARPVPWSAETDPPLPTTGLLRALDALSSALDAERRATLHRAVYDSFTARAPDPLTLSLLSDALDDPWATRCAEALIALLDAAPERALSVTVKHPWARERCIARKFAILDERLRITSLNRMDRYTLSAALMSLPNDERCARWVIDRYDALDLAIVGDQVSRYRPLQWLTHAAKQGSSLALRALVERVEAGAKLWEQPYFFENLPDDLVRAVAIRGGGALAAPQRFAEWSQLLQRFLDGANEGERERWWPSLRALHERAGDGRGLLLALRLAPEREVGAVIERWVPSGLATIHDAEALARSLDDREQKRVVIERAMQRFGPKHSYATVDWLNAALVRFVPDERAMQWLRECYAPNVISPGALPPSELRRFIEGRDLRVSDEWLRLAPSRALVSALSALGESAGPLLEQCAEACFSWWLRDGARRDVASWFSLRDFIAHASTATVCAMAEHPWELEDEWAAHEIMLRIAASRAREQDVGALDRAARTLRDRFASSEGSAWMRAVRTWVASPGTPSFERVFRPAPSDMTTRDVARDAEALGVRDAVFSLGDELSSQQGLALLTALGQRVSDAAFDRATPWIERVLAANCDAAMAALRARVARLPLRTLQERWVTESSRQRASTVLTRPFALRALAGDEGFSRIGDALVRAVDAVAKRA